MGDFFNSVFVHPIINVLIGIYQLLSAIQFPYALGFSIVLLTGLIRFLLYPLTTSQMKMSKKMQEITPHLNKLKDKHKNDAKTLQAETMKLYKEFGFNPASGCLPLLIQIPIFIALYSALNLVITSTPKAVVENLNKILLPFLHVQSPLNFDFFGVSLAARPSDWQKEGFALLAIPVITAVLQLVQSKMMTQRKTKTNGEKNKKYTHKKEAKKSDQEDMQKMMQIQMTYLMPLFIGYISYGFPIGLALYWNIFNVFGILQQYKVQGLGGLADWIKR